MDGSTIYTIRAYVQFQSERKTQIATWANSRLFVVNEGKEIYGDRLIADFTDNILFLKIIKVQYKDSGTYSIDVFVEPLASANSAATLNVYGMFLVIFNAYYHFGKWSMKCFIRHIKPKFQLFKVGSLTSDDNFS